MSETLGEILELLKEKIRGVLEVMPREEDRQRFARDPNRTLPELRALAATNPKEVSENAAIPLLALENPAGVESLHRILYFSLWVHDFYGPIFLGIQERTSCQDKTR